MLSAIVTETDQVNGGECFQVSKAQTSGYMESSHQEMAIDNQEAKEETPGFTVYPMMSGFVFYTEHIHKDEEIRDKESSENNATAVLLFFRRFLTGSILAHEMMQCAWWWK
ncbi:unnamed protein product [Vicia faba]|uniref:Uncharacterized protein n=1 Tax=Vicia faba TaxID=3906 RepID=A0AAV0ZQ27_VICFA|nr:unnamed protein product [Vicia faba]